MKRSVIIRERKTSVSLENEFWNSFREIAKEREQGIGQLLTTIDAGRTHGNLSSAIRLFVLNHYQNRHETRKSLEQFNIGLPTSPI
jgi:predicted DNA-binding ribbon-helix-helix protein